MKKYRLIANRRVSAIALACAMASAGAQAVITEIIIEAERTEGSLQETPVAVAAFDAEMLEAQGIESLRDLSLVSPSLHSYDFPTSTTNLSTFLRGYGNPDSQTLTIDNPIGIYMDGVYLARTSTALIDVLDLERVEVLRGPQGTLFGRNSAAGTIQLITKKPADEFGGRVKAGVGNYGYWSATASVDVPLADTLRSKFSYNQSSFDGWVKNEGPNSTGNLPAEDFYAKEQEAYRAAFSFDAANNVVIDYSYDYAEVNATPQYFQQDKSQRQKQATNLLTGSAPYRYILPEGDNESEGHTLVVDWFINDNLNLKSITSYREMREATTQNWSDTLFFGTIIDYDTESTSQEFQLSGTAFDNFMDFIAGIYWFDEQGDKTESQFTNGVSGSSDVFDPAQSTTPIGSGGNALGGATFDTDLESAAIYVHSTLHLDDWTELRLGLRYTEDDRDAIRGVTPAQPSISFSPGSSATDYNQVDWLVSLSHMVTDEINAYARIATGYRAGGIAERELTFDQDALFEPEESISYELGAKADWLENRLRTNIAVYRSEVDEYILTLSGPPGNFASFVEVVSGDTTFTGAEIDIIAEPIDNFQLTLNYAYLDTELKNVVVPQSSFLFSGGPAGGPDLRGQDISMSTYIPFAPRHAITLAADLSAPLHNTGASVNFHIDYAWRDDVNSQPKDGLPVDPFGLVNLRLGVSDIALGGDAVLDVALWAKNAGDQQEVVYDLSAAGFQYNEPATYGVDISVDF